jgi:Tfp pilus assembly pilus retraction ATPase PilT
VIQTGVRDGSQTLERSLSQLIRAGVVSDRDAKAHSLNPDEIRPI